MTAPQVLAVLVLGSVLTLGAERRRLRRLRGRFLAELHVLASRLERRRALLVRLGETLPEELPACHGDLEVLGRHQRQAAEALALLWETPSNREAALAFSAAEAAFTGALAELIDEAGAAGPLRRLVEVQGQVELQRRSVDDAYAHALDRRGRGLPARLLGLFVPAQIGWAAPPLA
ncbi:MAG: hypothetical protein O2816_11840 [Planctomycetota bacterium]|nr:hypothetical protein [Planctomycetota bacterium]